MELNYHCQLLSWSDINSISGTCVSEGIARKTTCGFSTCAPVRLFRYQVFWQCGFVSLGGRLQRKPSQSLLRISRFPSRKRSFLISKIIWRIITINQYSLRHRKCGVRGGIHELFVSNPERARNERVRAFWHKQWESNTLSVIAVTNDDWKNEIVIFCAYVQVRDC